MPDFQNAFDPDRGLEFLHSRAYWLGLCSELVYPGTAEEKEADRKASEARAAEKALRPSWWKPSRQSARTAEFERARAGALAAVSRVAQTEALRIESELKAWGFDRFQFLSSISTQCFVAASSKLIIVCFRGTEPNRFWDIYDDLMAIPMRYSQVAGLVHVGFWAALKQVWKDIDAPPLVWPVEAEAEEAKGFLDYVREFRNEQFPQLVWLTGHSLGGALATTAAARLVGEGALRPEEIGGVYTFGQPRVGDKVFANSYPVADRHFRVVHDNDVVTRVPPESLRRAQAVMTMFMDENPSRQAGAEGRSGFQYRHVGRLAFLSSTTGIKLDISKWECSQRRMLARLRAPFRKGSFLERLLPGLTDHSMAKYNKALAVGAVSPMLDSDARQERSLAERRGRSMLVDREDRQTPPSVGAPSNNGLRTNLLAVFSGSSIGLLVGLLMGLSVSPTVGLVLGGLASSLALILGLNDRYFTQAKAIRIGTFGLVCVAGALLGIFMRTHHLLSPSPEAELERYTADTLGYTREEAREFIKLTRFGIASPNWNMVTQSSANGETDSNGSVAQITGSTVLVGSIADAAVCRELEPRTGDDPARILARYDRKRGAFAKIADRIREVPEEQHFNMLTAVHLGMCTTDEQD